MTGGQGPPDDTGPPERVDLPDAAAVADAVAEREPPYGVRFRHGGEVAEVEADGVRVRGNNTVEIHHSGRIVTVRADTELEPLLDDRGGGL